MARDVNLVWNYCNALSFKVWERECRFIGNFELHKYLKGASKEGLTIGSLVFCRSLTSSPFAGASSSA